jgi:hypothetical protein
MLKEAVSYTEETTFGVPLEVVATDTDVYIIIGNVEESNTTTARFQYADSINPGWTSMTNSRVIFLLEDVFVQSYINLTTEFVLSDDDEEEIESKVTALLVTVMNELKRNTTLASRLRNLDRMFD